MSLEPLASPPDALQRFVETEDWMLLEKPLIFQVWRGPVECHPMRRAWTALEGVTTTQSPMPFAENPQVHQLPMLPRRSSSAGQYR